MIGSLDTSERRSLAPVSVVGQNDTTPTAAALALRAQGGEREAFDALYALTVERIYALCWRMAGDEAEGEQLTQDVFVRAWQHLGTFRGDSEFSTWIYRLAINVVLEQRRADARRSARWTLTDDGELPERGTRAPDTEQRMDLERAIASLPRGARAVLVLHDIEGYKHEEIGAMMEIAVGTVKAQLHRARRLMRERLST
jgi:RNA polymerase sigma-70 factor, ECF subfamily